MGSFFSSSRPPTPDKPPTEISTESTDDGRRSVRLTSVQPIVEPGTPTSGHTGGAMYRRHRFRSENPRALYFSPRYERDRYYRYSRSTPWYSQPRREPRAADRDRAFWVDLSDDKERNRELNRIPAPSDSAEEVLPEVKPVELATRLHVKEVDLHISENSQEHNTADYECTWDEDEYGKKVDPHMVIRRGQSFKVTLTFNRTYNIEKNNITLVFNLGDDYKPNKRLSASFVVDETGTKNYEQSNKWGATVVDMKDESLTLSVFVPTFTAIGEWEFGVKTTVFDEDGEKLIWQYNHNMDINIIFNPWCKGDTVYMSDEKWRKEVVQNDSGPIYYGSAERMGARNWNFGQFDSGMLHAAIHLVRKACGFRVTPKMASPAAVSRMLSQIVNSNDDNGVLQGNWSGDYEGGTAPSAWVGSVAILTEYMANRKPVSYGQCWVFSGVLTTVCRAIGLPCRSITNFASAHNTDAVHLSIDKFQKLDDFGNYIDVDHGDSVWNYHCWNEAWMARTDLSDNKEWDGWQVIDATPQEYSDGVFCCGPAPLRAIKEGEIDVGKDVAFIFAEVNADRIDLQEDRDTGELMERRRRTAAVGKKISTHVPTGRSFRGASMNRSSSAQLDLERLDLTNDYKYEEGSSKERQIYKKAERAFRLRTTGAEDEDEYRVMPDEEVEVVIEDIGDVFVGSEFKIVVPVTNTGSKTRKVKKVAVMVFYMTYHATNVGLAAMEQFTDITLEPGEKKTFEMNIEESQSMSRPQYGYNFEIKVVVSFADSDHLVTEDTDFRLRRPDVQLEGPEYCRPGEVIEVKVVFTNLLTRELTRCKLLIEGGFLMIDPTSKEITIPQGIAPGATWSTVLKLKPRLRPKNKIDRDLSVGFESTQLKGIIGYYAVELKDN